MSKKKIAEHIEFPELKNPLEYFLEDVTNLDLKPEKDTLLKIIKIFKSGVINNEDVRALNLPHTLSLANQGNQEALYLFDISTYLFAWVKISKRIDVQINLPVSNNALAKYYFAYLTGWVSDLNKRIDKAQFLNLINIFRELHNSEVELKSNVLNIIKRNLVELEINFYLSSSICQSLLRDIHDKTYKEDLSLIIHNANSNYFFKIFSLFTHEIPQNVINFYETKAPIPKKFFEGIAKNELTAWPHVIIPSEKNFLDSSEVNIVPQRMLSINDLLRFTTHLMPPSLFHFHITGGSFTKSELKKLNEGLKIYLIEKGFLNSAGQLKLQCVYNNNLSNINPAKFKQEVNNYLQKMFIRSPWKTNIIDNLIQQACEIALNGRKTFYKLSFFNSINALALVIQTLEHEPTNPINEIEDCFLSELARKTILSKLYDTLLLSYKTFVINRDFVDCTQKHQAFFNLAVSIVENKIISTDFNGLILQTGDPINHGDLSTKHAFYVIIKKIQNQFKIFIVNGGSNADQDPVFESFDQGYGGFWLCRTFLTQSLDASVKTFLTHFVYRVISLRYTTSLTEADFKITLDNIYFKNDKFIGYSQGVTYELLKSNNFDNLLTIASDVDSPSFPSQTIENCTIHNLKQALKIFFNWAEYQFYLFVNDLFCRYNFLLKHYSSSGILILTEADQDTVNEVSQDGKIPIADEDYQGKISSIPSIKCSNIDSLKTLLFKPTENRNLNNEDYLCAQDSLSHLSHLYIQLKEAVALTKVDDSTPRAIEKSTSDLISEYAGDSSSMPEDSTKSYIPLPTTTQSFYAGVSIGSFIISPTIHYLNDQVNSKNQEKTFFDYYYDQFSFNNLAKSTTFSITFYSLPNSFSMANKVLIAKMVSNISVNKAQLSTEYAVSMLGYLVISFTSFSVITISKHSEYYHDYPFAVGVLASTIGDIVKLSYDAADYTYYYLTVGKDYSNVTEEL